MIDPESMIRLARPEDIEAGPHCDQLASLLLERRGEPPSASWSLRRYGLVLATVFLCFGLVVLLQPRNPDLRLWSEQRELLSSLLPSDQVLASYPAPASTPLRFRSPTSFSSNVDLDKLIRDDCNALNDVLADMTVNPEK